MTDPIGVIALFVLAIMVCGVVYTVASDIRRTQGKTGCFTWSVLVISLLALARYFGILKVSMP